MVTVGDLLGRKRPKMPPTLTPYIPAERLTALAPQLTLGRVG